LTIELKNFNFLQKRLDLINNFNNTINLYFVDLLSLQLEDKYKTDFSSFCFNIILKDKILIKIYLKYNELDKIDTNHKFNKIILESKINNAETKEEYENLILLEKYPKL
jgi:hypothetical protein